MAISSSIQPIKVAIYFDLVAGRSARETASRFNISHPTAVKYADEALAVLRLMPAVVLHPELAAYMEDSVKKQAFGFTPAIRELLEEALKPFLEQAASAVTAGGAEPTLTISAKVPESTFYKFKRLVAAENKTRGPGDELTISSHLADIITTYVETGVQPTSAASFQHADVIMDEMRQLLARHGITSR